MATRSFIGKLLKDGSITGIYCHHDGYPEGVGSVLQENYTDLGKLDQLLQLGSISTLGAEIGEKHNFSSRSPGWTTAYHRDRGDSMDPPLEYSDVVELIKNVGSDIGVAWAYVFHYDGWRHYKLNQ